MIGSTISRYVDFPMGAVVGEVSEEIIFNTGLINGPILHLFAVPIDAGPPCRSSPETGRGCIGKLTFLACSLAK